MKKELIEKEIEKVAVTDVEDKETISAEETFNQYSSSRKRITMLGVLLLTSIELVIGGTLAYHIQKKELHKRVTRELEMRTLGEVRLSTGKYIGETDFGYFFGDGKFDFKSGTSYEGNWDDNLMSGNGSLEVPIEGTYVGEFLEAEKSGEGTFTWDDGSVYEGEWYADKMSGQGVYTSNTGEVYTGTFQDNAFYDGECVFNNDTGNYQLVYKDGEIDSIVISYTDGTSYAGAADESNLNGFGVMTFTNGDSYAGNFVSGIRSGLGKYTWASGDTYDGEWSDDKMSGEGIYTFIGGTSLTGTFLNNTFTEGSYQISNSFGNYTFTISEGEPTGVHIILTSGTEYEGDMDETGLNGNALITYSNGDNYDGQVASGKKSGTGKYTWASGASYDGEWSGDLMSGNGVYMYPTNEEGYKLEGTFANGVPEGDCEYYVSETTHYQTTWSGGECIKISE